MANNDFQSNSALLIEDDRDIGEILSQDLRSLGFQVEQVTDGRLGLERALSEQYSLVIVDLNLPGMFGLDVCRELRDQRQLMPILIVSSRSDDMDRILGLELGADDYITKPVKLPEFRARVRALMRRSTLQSEQAEKLGADGGMVVHGPLTISVERREIRFKEHVLELTPLEYDALLYLTATNGKVVTRAELLRNVWGYEHDGYEGAVVSTMKRLRAKLDEHAGSTPLIQTVRGVGYRLLGKEELL